MPDMRCIKFRAMRSAVRMLLALPLTSPKKAPFDTMSPSLCFHCTNSSGSTSSKTCMQGCLIAFVMLSLSALCAQLKDAPCTAPDLPKQDSISSVCPVPVSASTAQTALVVLAKKSACKKAWKDYSGSALSAWHSAVRMLLAIPKPLFSERSFNTLSPSLCFHCTHYSGCISQRILKQPRKLHAETLIVACELRANLAPGLIARLQACTP